MALGLFERHGRAVRRFLFRLTRDPAAADDLAGEVFLRVVRASATYEPRAREAAWVFRIARNGLRDAHRRRMRSVEHAVDADAAAPADQIAGLDLQHGLDALPEEEREALLLGEDRRAQLRRDRRRDRRHGGRRPVTDLPSPPDTAGATPAAAAPGGGSRARFP